MLRGGAGDQACPGHRWGPGWSVLLTANGRPVWHREMVTVTDTLRVSAVRRGVNDRESSLGGAVTGWSSPTLSDSQRTPSDLLQPWVRARRLF